MYLILFIGDEVVLDKDVWCWCCEEEYGNMFMCEGFNCLVKWCYFGCMGLLYSLVFYWYCLYCNGRC